MPLELDKQDLSTHLASRILQSYDAGAPLPSERAMAQRFRCSRGTVRSAMELLASRGMLETVARHGHRLVEAAATPSTGQPSSSQAGQAVRPSVRAWPTVALLTFGRGLEDPGSFDAVSGAITQASREKINLLVIDMGDVQHIESLTTLEALHPGLEIGGYIIMGKPPLPVRQLLEKSVKPCVVLGTFHGELTTQMGRFLRVGTPSEATLGQVASHLVSLGHRRILFVAGRAGEQLAQRFARLCEAQGAGKVEVDCLAVDLFDTQDDYLSSALALGPRVMARLKPEHTALFMDFGGYGGLSVWRHLLESGRRIPEDLSVIIGGGRVDIFVEAFEIATVRRSAMLEGEVCVREAARQVRSGRVEYGYRQIGSEYMPRRTVGPAPRRPS